LTCFADVIDEKKLEEQANLLKDWKRDATTLHASSLPSGTKRFSGEGYEGYAVPANIPDPVEEKDLIPVAEMNSMAQVRKTLLLFSLLLSWIT
jgi:hypothetical protein